MGGAAVSERRKHCRFCGASADMPLDDALDALINCVNCLSDIQLRGQWTGVGNRIFHELAEAHGRDALADAYTRACARRAERNRKERGDDDDNR